MKIIPNMNKRIWPLVLLMSPVFFFPLRAQNGRDSLQSQTITVIKSYTPQIGDANKITVNPDLREDSEFPKISLEYRPLEIDAVSTHTIEKGKLLRPQLHAENKKNLPGYAEFAAGNAKAFRLKAFYSTLLPSDWTMGSGISLQGLGKVLRDSLLLTPYHEWRLAAFAHRFDDRRKWTIRTAYAGKRLRLRDTLQPLRKEGPAFATHRFRLSGEGKFYQGPFRKSSTNYTFFSFFRTPEHDLRLQSLLVFPVAGFDIRTSMAARMLAGRADKGYTHFTASISPAFRLEQKNLLLNLGFKAFYVSRRGAYPSFHFYPDLRMDFHMIPEFLTVYLQYEGKVKSFSYEELSASNPYVMPLTPLEPAVIPYRFAGGFLGSIGSRTEYHIILGTARTRRHPFTELRKTTRGIGYAVVYDRLDNFYFKVRLSYVAGENFETKIKFDYYQNNPAHLKKAWNMEDYRISWLLRGRTGKFSYRSDLFYVGPRYNIWEGKIIRTGETVDLNLRLGYTVLPDTEIYLEGNNLLHRNDMPFYPYPVHGLRILAGFTYSFR